MNVKTFLRITIIVVTLFSFSNGSNFGNFDFREWKLVATSRYDKNKHLVVWLGKEYIGEEKIICRSLFENAKSYLIITKNQPNMIIRKESLYKIKFKKECFWESGEK